MQQVILSKIKRSALLCLLGISVLSLYSFGPKPAVKAAIVWKNVNFLTPWIYGIPGSGNTTFADAYEYIYDSLDLESIGLSRNVYELALKGMEKLQIAGKLQYNILSIVDFSKPSTEKRLYVIDLDQASLLFHTWVAHGRNSGEEMARSFSNKPRSKKSSLGFFVTGQTYFGSNGYSLKLEGMENGINNNARQRAIVIHGADYVNQRYIQSQGYIGRSQGCPAVMSSVSGPLINTIKEGTCLFIYHPTSTYTSRSALLR